MIFDLGNEAYSDGPIEPNDDQFKEKSKEKICTNGCIQQNVEPFLQLC